MSDAVQIPTEFVPPSRINPQMLLLYGAPKVGKTVVATMLPDSLLLELEPAGADFVSARKIDIPDMATLLKTLDKLIALRAAKTPACSRLIIDTIDEVERLCDPYALAQYKASVLGKDFQGTSIIELPQGAGYGRLRDCMGEMLWKFCKAADEVILLAHVREKLIERKGVQEVAAQDVDLTGKVRAIVVSRCSSIGYMRRDFTDTVHVNFKTSDTVNCGSRCGHLTGKEIVLSEKKDGKIVAYWDRFYLPEPTSPPAQEAAP
jgi:hypothetical protein